MVIVMASQILTRIIELASEGYDVRFTQYYGDAIQIRVSYHNHHAARVISRDEIALCNFDVILYSINRLVEVLDEGPITKD